ncbi:helix-turn-helix transcriptional regulator [Hyphococcus luteus]|nr:helix-turn-helix transcriptional regulator [Marinicaulis flavus]
MQIRTVKDLGAIIRDRRKKADLDQADLAQKVGVSRQWINEVEKGKPRAEISLILKTLDALGVVINIDGERPDKTGKAAQPKTVDIDSIIENARRPKQ